MKRLSTIFKIVCILVLSVQCFLMVSPEAMALELPATLAPSEVCTRDINMCGNSSICSCPDEYEYNSTVGYCLIDDVDNAMIRGDDVYSPCSMKAEFIPTPCTDEENYLGYPIKCLCPGSTYYDQRLGDCVVSFR